MQGAEVKVEIRGVQAEEWAWGGVTSAIWEAETTRKLPVLINPQLLTQPQEEYSVSIRVVHLGRSTCHAINGQGD